MAKEEQLLLELQGQIRDLQHQAELIKTVLIVKEPNTVQSAQAFEGLRKQVIASATERRSHLAQLVAFAVAVSRATAVDDLKPQVNEWLEQAGIREWSTAPEGKAIEEYFEDVSGQNFSGKLQLLAPAYVDSQTEQIVRLGRVQSVLESSISTAPGPDAAASTTTDPRDVTA